MPTDPQNKPQGLMRSLGQFVGHIVKAVKTPADPDRTEVSRTTESSETTDEHGRKVTLRRTTIEEVERSDGPA